MLENYIRNLEELVNFDSGTHNPAGVTHAAEIMLRHYESIGLFAELVDLGPSVGRGLFATNKPGATSFDVMLNAHLDTVFDDGTAAERPLCIENGHIRGPGACDCKSGVLTIFYAIKQTPREVLDNLSIAVCYNPDEEIGSPYSHTWIENIASKSRCAVVVEPARPQGELVRSRKGSRTYKGVFHGKTAHAGNNPKDGRSALLAAAKFTVAVCALQDLDGAGTSVNVGSFHSGSAVNVVADTCEIGIDTRFWNDDDGKALHSAIMKLAAQSWGQDISLDFHVRSECPSMPLKKASCTLVELYNKAAQIEDRQLQWVDAGGASDANHIAVMGIPVIDGAGPAGGGLHTEQEYSVISSIEPSIRTLSRFLQQLPLQRI